MLFKSIILPIFIKQFLQEHSTKPKAIKNAKTYTFFPLQPWAGTISIDLRDYKDTKLSYMDSKIIIINIEID
jgi:hypothetical protein